MTSRRRPPPQPTLDDPPHPGKRDFLRWATASTWASTRASAWVGTLTLGSLGLSACGGRDDDASPPDATPAAQPSGNGRFLHGVASGDPLSDRVVLWTRWRPDGVPSGSPSPAPILRWEVALDPGFTQTVASGDVQCPAERDHTTKVDVTGLQPGTTYYYRFIGATDQSPTGRTRTLRAITASPLDTVPIKLAVVTCANYAYGYFNAYADIAAQPDLDAVVHLGDYIYEDGPGGYATQRADELGRGLQPARELLTLADYRERYAQVHTDPDVQALHAQHPLIAVWDDHEVTDNAWRDGGLGHDPSTEGNYANRRQAAQQAFLDWLPIREGSDPGRIYRSFHFGSILALHMLDTRLIGRDQQLSYSDFLEVDAQGINTQDFEAALNAPQRQLLGMDQAAWLEAQLQASTATWQVLGQQVLMARMNVSTAVALNAVTLPEYQALKRRSIADPASLSIADQATLALPDLPYNLDAWDGYPAAREAILSQVERLGHNLVVLAGDTHNAWASDLRTAAGVPVGVEFGAPSASSPGFEAALPQAEAESLANDFVDAVDTLRYADTWQRGYLVVTATRSACQCDWRYVSTITQRGAGVATGQTLRVLPGVGGRQLQTVDGTELPA